ncbi:DUF4145 domain-containing protein [Roseateles sp.]|uniref:DUF4145 domain-containing protein n=1 Tax=Roseateles sp. TaxID=1971397 RepID=UPI002F427E69
MPVDRKLAAESISKEACPRWKCPSCKAGPFRLEKNTLHYELEGHLELVWREDWFDPATHAKYRFTALLRCANDLCLEVASVAGHGTSFEAPDEDANRMDYAEEFFPTYFNPSPPLIDVPEACPEDVATQLKRAFVASWGEPGAAAGRVRIATELLLTHLKVPKTQPKRAGGRTRLNLHQRIDVLPAKHAEVREALLAIKWLGNAGAHEAEMPRHTVYDAFDILELVLRKLYSRDQEAVERLVKAVNKRKGSAAKKRKAER